MNGKKSKRLRKLSEYLNLPYNAAKKKFNKLNHFDRNKI